MKKEDVFEGLKEDVLHDTFTITPQIGSLKIYGTPSGVNQIIRDLERNGYIIDEKDFPYIEEFLKSPFFEENRKEELKKHLDQNYNKYLFDKLFDNYDSFSVRLNGVPYKGENRTVLEIPSKEVKAFLLTGVIPETEKGNIMFYSTVMDIICKQPYFTSEFCYEKIKPYLQAIDDVKETIIEQREKIAQELDKNNLASLNHKFTNQRDKKIHINERLKQDILSQIPDSFSQLEKSIFIYLRLCEYFSYDPKYFASVRNHKQEHEDIYNIEKLSQQYNQVVCYQFTYVLSDILTSIGVKCIDNIQYFYDIDENEEMIPSEFINTHANLKYIIDDTIIQADSTRSILQGDLSAWKYLKLPDGIRCENYTSTNREKFKCALNSVIDYIKQDENKFRMREIYEEYNQLKKDSYLDMHDKLSFVYEKILQFPYDEIDLLSFIHSLIRIVFEQSELKDNISTIPLKNREDEVNLLISANKLHFDFAPYDTHYYTLNLKNKSLQEITRENIIKSLHDNLIETVEREDVIPSIKSINDWETIRKNGENLENKTEIETNPKFY